MKAIVICADTKGDFPLLDLKQPAVLTPALGQSPLVRTLKEASAAGAKKAIVLASDRPEMVRAALERGETWGIALEVAAESRELTKDEARAKYRDSESQWLPEGSDVFVTGNDALGQPATGSAGAWRRYIEDLFRESAGSRIGAREIAPGVWAGRNCAIHPTASLEGPCWLGESVIVNERAKVGPRAYVEDMSVIERASEIVNCWVGPRTYVGCMTRLSASLAWGSGLHSLEYDSFVRVQDAFLLADLSPTDGHKGATVPGRLFAGLALIATAPIWLFAYASGGKDWLTVKQAVAPGSERVIAYAEFSGFRGLLKRIPQLWNILRGEFAWVGNRPLSGLQAAQLETEFDRLWLASPIGLISLADAEGCADEFGEEARVHSAFYAAQASLSLNLQILSRTIPRTPKISTTATESAHASP